LKLRTKPTLGLIAIDTLNYKLLKLALERCVLQVDFDDVLILSDAEGLVGGARTIKIKKIESKDEYNDLVLSRLAEHARCDYYLVVQYDGFVIDATLWDNEFLKHDYIGAPWPNFAFHRVGNGGFSLRSKRLIDSICELRNFRSCGEAEDVFIGRTVRPLLESKFGIRFASEECALRFSFESPGHPKSAFGFHGVLNLAIAYASKIDEFFDAAPPELLRLRNRELEFGAMFIDSALQAYFMKRLKSFSAI
jgi:hypothetical protein